MVTSRVAFGSVSTLALAGLLLGVAPRLFSQSFGPEHSSPWGALASLPAKLSTGSPSDGDRAQLLKIAALKSAQNEAAPVDPAMVAAAQLSASPAAAPQSPAASNPDAQAATPGLANTVVADTATPTTADAPIQMAAAEPSDGDGTAVAPLPPAAPVRSGSALININKASTDALDRFPGAGHIGHAIVSHRPYHAIADLVRKRVLRTSDFQKIQGHISVD